MPFRRRLLLFNVFLRGMMELSIVAGLGYWGFATGSNVSTTLLLGIGAPAIGFGFWGAVDFRRVGRLAEALRLMQELVISGAAALQLYEAGQPALGLALAGLSAGHHILVYATGDRLLKPARARPAP